MRENIVITPEIIRAQSGEAAQLLSKLNKLDRNSKQARKIRRQLRRLGVKLSGHTEEQKVRRRRTDFEVDQVRKRERLIKKSLKTPFMTRKQRERIIGVDENRVLKYAIMLAQHGYDTPSKIAEILVMKFDRLPRASATELGKRALLGYKKYEHIEHARMLENPELVRLRRVLRRAKKEGISKQEALRRIRRGRKKSVRNPPSGVKEIYGRIMAIEAQKGARSNYPNEYFRHDFKKGSKIYGLPDGSILIKGKKKLWKEFDA